MARKLRLEHLGDLSCDENDCAAPAHGSNRLRPPPALPPAVETTKVNRLKYANIKN